MGEIDWSRPDLHGGNHVYLDAGNVVKLLVDAFDSGLYNKLPIQPSHRKVDKSYSDNETFWKDALGIQHFPSMRIRLQGFHLTEWTPSAPGRYFTPDAQYSRRKAETSYRPSRNEYDLDGKNLMILGGVGSFRLGVREINGKGHYFLGASSSGVSHEGIPVALNEPHYRQVIQIIRMYGGSKVTLVGTLQLLPIDLSPLDYDRGIPKYCLVLDEIEDAQPSPNWGLFTTVAITFRGLNGWGWSFCTFQPDPIDKNLHRAVNWLKSYATRYSATKDPSIMADFDEHYPQQFDTLVEFSLVDIANNSFNMNRLQNYVRRHGGLYVAIKEVQHMDTYNVSGQAGAVGPNAHAHDMTFTQITTQAGDTIDLPSLAKELSALRTEMKKKAVEPEEDAAVGAIAEAETEAKNGHAPKVLEFLAKAGKWALEIATQIGTPLAIAAIKASLNIP